MMYHCLKLHFTILQNTVLYSVVLYCFVQNLVTSHYILFHDIIVSLYCPRHVTSHYTIRSRDLGRDPYRGPVGDFNIRILDSRCEAQDKEMKEIMVSRSWCLRGLLGPYLSREACWFIEALWRLTGL